MSKAYKDPNTNIELQMLKSGWLQDAWILVTCNFNRLYITLIVITYDINAKK